MFKPVDEEKSVRYNPDNESERSKTGMFFAILIFCLIAETLGKAALTGIAIPIAIFEKLAEQISNLF